MTLAKPANPIACLDCAKRGSAGQNKFLPNKPAIYGIGIHCSTFSKHPCTASVFCYPYARLHAVSLGGKACMHMLLRAQWDKQVPCSTLCVPLHIYRHLLSEHTAWQIQI